MKKNLLKKYLVSSCAAILLLVSSGIMVYANVSQEKAVTNYKENESTIYSDSSEAVSASADLLVEDLSGTESIEDNSNIIGSSSIVVGDSVTATFNEETGEVELYSDNGTLWNNWSTNISGKIISIKVASGTVKLPVDSSKLFSECTSLMLVDFNGFDTSQVTSMNKMFYGCCGLTSLDLSSFDTSNVIDMSGMFSKCTNLENLNLDSFDTSNVTNMSSMFYNCCSLKSLKIDTFDTSKVVNMGSMFSECRGLKTIDLSHFNTSNVLYMGGMFGGRFNAYGGCSSLTSLDLSGFDTSKVQDMQEMFLNCWNLQSLDVSGFDTSQVCNMEEMFCNCQKLENVNLSSFNTSNVTDMSRMFHDCYKLISLDLSNFNTEKVTDMDDIFFDCQSLTFLDISGFDTSNVKSYNGTKEIEFFRISYGLTVLKTPKFNNCTISLPNPMYDELGNKYTKLPVSSKSITLKDYLSTITPTATPTPGVTRRVTATPRPTQRVTPTPRPIITPVAVLNDVSKCSVAGVSLSYGYSGKAYTPTIAVTLQGKTLIKDRDYVVKYIDNKEPGTALMIIIGKGNYTGVKIKTFEIVDCVSSVVSGKTYQLIPKNNSLTAVCSYSGRMVNNTKVYITDRSSSEAMKFKAVKNSDGTWKFINAKCELAFAVQQNSSEVGKGLVLYDQTTKKAQNWNLTRKSDNSFAITNSVTGLYVAMSDMSAPKGTTLSMKENSGRGDQRFYIVETTAVNASFDGTYSVKASKNKTFGLNIASSSKVDGANVILYKYSNNNAKKFKIMYSGGGYYRLVNVNSGLALTVKGNTKANGANVIQSKWAAQSGQRWKITKNSNGTVTLKNALGTVLHLSSNKTANGTNVVARNASTTGAQKWYLG